MSGTLILVRHGQSEWNLKNLFTGWRNPDLTEKGQEEARATGVKYATVRISQKKGERPVGRLDATEPADAMPKVVKTR